MSRRGIARKITDRDLSATPKDEQPHDPKQLLSVKEAAAFLGVSASYLNKSRCEGALKGRTTPPKFVKIEKSVFYKRSELLSWLDSLESRSVT